MITLDVTSAWKLLGNLEIQGKRWKSREALKVKGNFQSQGKLGKPREALKLKKNFGSHGKCGSEIWGDLNKNMVTLDVTSARKLVEPLNSRKKVESQGKR